MPAARDRRCTNSRPEAIVVDDRVEFVSNALDLWAHAHDVRLHFIRPDGPVENAFVDSSNRKFRERASTPTGSTGSITPARSLMSGSRATTKAAAVGPVFEVSFPECGESKRG